MPLLAMALAAAAVLDFARRTRSTFEPSGRPVPGVVFTGQFNRVHAGLALLESGTVAPLFVSGTNPGAGIPMAGFADQFQLSPALRNALASGALVLSPQAGNTLENAAETRRWLAAQPPDRPVVLITSRFHMPRASLALERELPGRVVWRHSVTEESVQRSHVITEFWKYLATPLAQSGVVGLNSWWLWPFAITTNLIDVRYLLEYHDGTSHLPDRRRQCAFRGLACGVA